MSRKTLRADTMDELMGKVAESLRQDCGVKISTATLMNYFRRVAEEHNGLVPTGS